MDDSNIDKDTIWNKLKRNSSKLGCKSVCSILKLWYTLQNPKTPAWVRIQIMGALAYFISPLDFIPDLIPGGFVDDLKVVGLALATALIYVGEPEKKKAQDRVKTLLPNCDC